MIAIKKSGLLLAAALGAPGGALCAEPDVAEGRAVARHVCSACHDIGADRPWPPTLQPPAPSFATLARQKKLEENYLRGFLAAPHGGGKRNMPDPRLLDDHIDALVGYLRARRAR